MKKPLKFSFFSLALFSLSLFLLNSCTTMDSEEKKLSENGAPDGFEDIDTGRKIEKGKKKDSEKPDIVDINQLKKDKLKMVARVYLDRILKGMQEDDYRKFSANMYPEMKNKINAKKFEQMMKSFRKEKGKLVSREYLGSLQSGLFTTFLWKARFEKESEISDKEKKSDKPVVETLIRLILGDVDGKFQVFGIYFM